MQLFRAFFVLFCLFCILIGLGFVPSSYGDKPNCTYAPIVENSTPSHGILGPESERDQKAVQNDQDSNNFSCSALEAQWVTADAAVKTFWITVLGLGLIGFTLFETLKAGLLIKEQNDIARRSARDQARAYVHAATAELADSELPFVYLEVENTGDTPAHWFEIGATSVVANDDGSFKDLINFDSVTRFTRWSGLASGIKLKAPTGSPMERLTIQNGKSGDKGVIVYGIIRYKTIFKEIYETQFAFTVSVAKADRFLVRPDINLETYKLVSQPAESK